MKRPVYRITCYVYEWQAMVWITATLIGFGMASPSSSAADFQVGAAKSIITPDPLLPVSGGMGPTHPVTKKMGDLTARTMVIAHGDTRVAIVSVDLLGFPAVLAARIGQQVNRIPADHIVIGATHTHSAPDVYAFPTPDGHTGDLNYIDFVCKRIAEAINRAIDNLQPARLKVNIGPARGKIAYNYYAPALYDSRASVLQAVDPNDQAIVTLVNYAIHPEVLGPERGVCSPDLVGPLCDRIETTVGGIAMFINGAQGGMVTADNRILDQPTDAQHARWQDDNSWTECERIGNTLADESLRLLGNAPTFENPTLRCRTMNVTFPVDSDEMWAVVQHSPLQYPHDPAQRTITSRLNLIEVGPALLLTIPGEALPNIGFYLKRKLPSEYPFLLGLTNDAFGYILTRVDFQSFPRYDYISRVSLGEMTGEILVESALQLMNDGHTNN